MKAACYFVHVMASLVTLFVIIYALKPTEIVASDIKLVPLLLFNISPFLGLAAITRWIAHSKLQLGLVFGVSVVTATAKSWILIEALIVNMHVLNFFLLIGLPNIAWAVVVVLLVIVLVVGFVEKRRNPMKV